MAKQTVQNPKGGELYISADHRSIYLINSIENFMQNTSGIMISVGNLRGITIEYKEISFDDVISSFEQKIDKNIFYNCQKCLEEGFNNIQILIDNETESAIESNEVLPSISFIRPDGLLIGFVTDVDSSVYYNYIDLSDMHSIKQSDTWMSKKTFIKAFLKINSGAYRKVLREIEQMRKFIIDILDKDR